MNITTKKPIEVSLFVKFLYLEFILALLEIYDEYDPTTDSMYLFLLLFCWLCFIGYSVVGKFSRGEKESYKTIRAMSYYLIVAFVIISLLIIDEPLIEYLNQGFTLFPLVGIINIVWLNSKVVKDWFFR